MTYKDDDLTQAVSTEFIYVLAQTMAVPGRRSGMQGWRAGVAREG